MSQNEEPNETVEMPEGAVEEPVETVFESHQELDEEPEPILVEEVVDVEPDSVQTVQEFAAPPILPEEPKKSNNMPWIILLVNLLVMCCCCVIVTGGVLWSFGDLLFGL